MKLLVKCHDSQKRIYIVESSDKIKHVKAVITVNLRVDYDLIRLMKAGEILRDDWTVLECGIKEEEVIEMLLLEGGRPCHCCVPKLFAQAFVEKVAKSHDDEGKLAKYSSELEDILKSKQSENEKEDEKTSVLECCVCLERNINCVLNCGHPYCKDCATGLSKCGICSAAITSRGILYL